MNIVQKVKEKKTQKAIRKLRQKGTRDGATTWNEQQQRKDTSLRRSSIGAWMKKDGWALIGIVLIVGGFIGHYLFFSEKMQVNIITISETRFIAKEDVQKEAEEYLQSKKFWLLPRRSYIMLSEKDLQEKITEKFSNEYALESVSVTKKYPHNVTIDVQERIPSVTWITSLDKNERVYTVDQNGVITQELSKKEDAHAGYPVIQDKNRSSLGIGWHVISSTYIDFVTDLQTTLYDTTGLEAQTYILPKIGCFKKEYVPEEVFKKAVNEKDSDEMKEKKRAIQERFQKGEITIDESIALLEQINTESTTTEPEMKKDDVERIEWETVNTPTECDIVKVGQDVYVETRAQDGAKKGFLIYFDTTQDLQVQLQHVISLLETQIEDPSQIEYIDVRIPDRVYYK